MTSSITIIEVMREFELYGIHPGTETQLPCVVELDLRSGKVCISTRDDTPNSIPMREWEGHMMSWKMPCLVADAANVLLQQVAGEAQCIRQAYLKHHEENDESTRFRPEGETLAAAVEIERICRDAEGVQIIGVPASDVVAEVISDLGITAETTNDEIDDIARWIEEEGRLNDPIYVYIGLHQHLRTYRDTLQQATQHVITE
jgi:hypothetical protein